MIHLLTGRIISKNPTDIVVSCGGVGFFVMIPTSVYANLPDEGETATIYTYLNVKEDSLELYGFSDERQQATFKMLTGVSGVGPKAGLSILSMYDSDRIAIAIASGDYKVFTACTGIGPKIAQRLVLELKDKVKGLGSLDASAVSNADTGTSGVSSQAIAALVSLGFTSSEAAVAVSKLSATLTTEEMIGAALKSMAK
ncbi:MAG: Holliday junction branch migration protein RuvA [Oscillospiraceae bacterium]